MHVGQSSTVSGQSGQYGEKHEPQLKSSERSDLHTGSAPCTDPWTAVYYKCRHESRVSNPLHLPEKKKKKKMRETVRYYTIRCADAACV
ncbi:hypothetical protein Bca52824_043994 [Brassica carinata]|uniref:Uncharacterized protein n=1 Tax=Brassica carinata TaxID=52824 RepID=A0A8X7S221_BRACI|nr:hypothetical protein Bca52824_043994 [Brassica carinata]